MFNRKVNKCSLAIAGMIIVLLITTSSPSGSIMSDSAFAKHSRDVGQAASVTDSCLNPVSDSNTNYNTISNGNCGGTISQQGRSGQASTPTTVQNANQTIEVQRSTTTPQSPGPEQSASLLVVNMSCKYYWYTLSTFFSSNSFSIYIYLFKKCNPFAVVVVV